MKLKIFVALLSVAFAGLGAPASQAAPTVENIANVSDDGPADNGDNEVDIAINPTNPANMIAGWNDYGVGNSCGVGWTADGGRTWHTDWLRGIRLPGATPRTTTAPAIRRSVF